MLVLLLKLAILASAALWSLVTRLIFSTIAHTIVLLVQAIKVPGEAANEGFRHVAEAIRGCFELVFELIMEAVKLVISAAFDLLKDSIAGSVAVTGSAVGGLAERLKASVEEGLKDLPELFEELSDMMSTMATELWSNFRDALGYVTENA